MQHDTDTMCSTPPSLCPVEEERSTVQLPRQGIVSRLNKKRSLGQGIIQDNCVSFVPEPSPLSKPLPPLPVEPSGIPFPASGDDDAAWSPTSSYIHIGTAGEEDSDMEGTREDSDTSSTSSDGFEDQNRTVFKRNMPHHPFRREDAPYMQAFSPILLDNDYHTFDLLRRINPTNSPSFHNHGRKPPGNVLDLGCGEGFWVLETARAWGWAGTRVTGFDLIDMYNNHAGVVRPNYWPAPTPENVTWQRGNFVKYPLPFPTATFDLVRMANLTLCIPKDRWFFVLSEAHRVLQPGGRLELIDDRLFFPAPQSIAAPCTTPRSPKPLVSAFDSDSDESDGSSLRMRADNTFVQSSLARAGSVSRPHELNTQLAKHLESLFEKMLVDRFQIDPRPEELIDDVLDEIFACVDNPVDKQEFRLAVPHRSAFEDDRARTKRAPRRSYDSVRQSLNTWFTTIEWDERPASPRDSAPRPSDDNADGLGGSPARKMRPVTPKAQQLLFGDAHTRGGRATVPYQPPGLVLLPATLLPCAPAELEMHACRHMNVLLGCKHALASFVLDHVDPDGIPLVAEDELNDHLWDYDRFRRRRFNWPSDYAGIRMEEEDEPEPAASPRPKSTSPKIFRFLSNPNSPMSVRQRAVSLSHRRGSASLAPQSTEVRVFTVFIATKAVS